MHVNLVEGREHLVPKRDSPYIVYHTVKHSLAELYELKDRVSRHGGELGFRLVYADRVANKVHIGYLFSDKGYEEKAAEFVGNPDMYYIGLHHGPFVSR